MRIEGKNAIIEALKSDSLTVEKLVIPKGYDSFAAQKLVAIAKTKNVRIEYADERIVPTKGLYAFVSDFQYCDIEDILDYAKSKNEPPFIILADGIEDPHNLGSIIRVAECSGVHGIVIPKRRSVTVNETVVRVSSGAAAHVKIAKADNLNNTIRYLKEQHFLKTYALETGGESIYSKSFQEGACLVIGSEGNGVHRLTKELCEVVSIPMFGRINSLNASVALGIAAYEVVRQGLQKENLFKD